MPVKAARVQLKLVQELAQLTRNRGLATMAGGARAALKTVASPPRDEPGPVLPLRSAPPTPWNRTVGPHRRFAMRATDLADIKRIKDAAGATVNDVVMAVSAGALREYLIAHDALPDAPLVAMVPVSIRTGNEADPWTNRVSSLFVQIPTNCDDPLERVRRCHDAMQAAKGQLELVPANVLVDLTETASPVVAASAMRLASRLRLAERFTLPANVVISNVPGPRQPLYLRGMQLEHYVPVSTIADGMGLNITVHSYLDRLDFGLVADRELVPDLWDLVDLHVAEIDRLLAAVAPSPARTAEKTATRRKKVSP
jgi:WS/DGAT/MGAT family acyltransferase